MAGRLATRRDAMAPKHSVYVIVDRGGARAAALTAAEHAPGSARVGGSNVVGEPLVEQDQLTRAGKRIGLVEPHSVQPVR